MRYIYPKDINLDNTIFIIRNNKILILNKGKINIFGFVVNLTNIKIIKEYNNFKILLDKDNFLEIYDKFLKTKIKNYKNIIINNEINSYILYKNNEKLNEYYKKDKTEIDIYISYVKKTGFLNIPIINIL